MKSSNDLFLLIKSLEKNEKRLFRLHVSKYASAEGSNYIRLFDAVDAQKNYNEEKLKKKFAGTALGKNFATEKKHLYGQILKTFRNHISEITIENRIRDLLREAEFLYKKALYVPCAKVLKRARTLAIEQEKHLLLFEIFEMEGNLLIISENMEALKKHVNEDALLVKKMFDKASNLFDFRVNHLRGFAMAREHGDDARNSAYMNGLEKIIRHPLYKNPEQAFSFEARHYFYFMYTVYYRMKDDAKMNYVYSKKNLELFEENPLIAAQKAHQHISVISNLSLAELEVKKYDDSLRTISKLKDFPVKSIALKSKAESNYHPRVLAILKYSGQFEKIDEYVGEMKAFLTKNKGSFSRSKEMNFYFNIASCYFGNENYREAIRWLNKLLNDKTLEDVRPDMNCFARTFNAIIHYELGNYDLLEHLCKKARKYFDKKDFHFEMEEQLILFIEKIILIDSEKKKRDAFIQYRKDVDAILKKQTELEPTEYFDFVSWADSKINNTSFAEEVIKKIGRKN